MPWGGSRVGSGRKPNKKKALRLVDRQAKGPDLAVERPIGLLEPPADLPAEWAVYWRELAPLALERGSLVESTVPGFRLLCELQHRKADASTKSAGWGVSETRLYLQLVKQVESSMARYMLTSFGKPAPVSERPKAEDEDDSFFGGPRAVGR